MFLNIPSERWITMSSENLKSTNKFANLTMTLYDSQPAHHHSCLTSSSPDSCDPSDTWQGWICHLTSLEHSRCQSEGCPRIWGALPNIIVIPDYTPWMQMSSLTTLASTQHGNMLRIMNTGSTTTLQLGACTCQWWTLTGMYVLICLLHVSENIWRHLRRLSLCMKCFYSEWQLTLFSELMSTSKFS